MNEDAFHAIMAKVRAAEDWDDARRAAAIASLVDWLKADFHKRYDTQIRPSRADGNWSQPSVPRPRGLAFTAWAKMSPTPAACSRRTWE